MNTFISEFFSSHYMPHGHCYLWKPEILWLNVISDFIIASAYFSIPIALFYFVRKRTDLKFKSLFILFSLFIGLCGITHILSIVVVWNGTYGIHGLSKLATALISATTAFYVFKTIPLALSLPSPAALKQALESANHERLQRIQTESKLDRERFFRDSTEGAHTGIAVCNSQGFIQIANNTLCRTFGYTPQELKHKSIEKIVAIQQYINEKKDNALNNIKKDLEGTHRDGHKIPIELTLKTGIEEINPIIYVSVTDLTEQQEASYKLTQQEKKYRAIVDNLPIGIHIFSVDKKNNIRLIDSNAAADTILGIQNQALHGLLLQDAFPETIATDIPDLITLAALSGTTSSRETIPYEDKNISGIFSTIFFQSTPRHSVALFHDVTQKRKADNELAQALRKFQLVMEGSNDGFWHWLDPKQEITEWSDSLFCMLGYDVQEFSPHFSRMYDMIHPDDRDTAKAAIRHSIASKQRFNIEYRIADKSNNYKWYRCRGTPYFSTDGLFLEMAGSLSDIHHTKLLQQDLMRSNKELEQFSFIASHDLKEPLRTIRTFVEYLLSSVKNNDHERIEEDAYFIKSACDRMAHLIEALLQLSRAGAYELQLVECNINEALTEVKTRLQAQINEYEPIITIAQDFPLIISDKIQLELIFQNLIQNSIKFCIKDIKPQINIGWRERTDTSSIDIYIRDQGIGIAQDKLVEIFGVFKKLHSADVYQGTGIGLAIVNKLVKRLNGSLRVESTEGVGTTVITTFPKVEEIKIC